LAPVGGDDKNHIAEKPIDLLKTLIGVTAPGAVVCDPFMGSGTTGVAAAEMGRKFIGVEIDRRSFDVACERIERAYAQGQLIPHEPPPRPVQEALL
jgi:site-specific DNA-methyltransferase (adenine-specific)